MPLNILSICESSKRCPTCPGLAPNIKLLKAVDPPVSVVIPYLCGTQLNTLWVHENDEVIVVLGGKTIGHARIFGTKKATNNWFVQMDGDAKYPKNYLFNVKKAIRKYGFPIMCSKRRGGVPIHRTHEHGLITKKDVFLSRCRKYPKGTKAWTGQKRRDIGSYFTDAKMIKIEYYHPQTEGEKQVMGLGLTGVSLGTTAGLIAYGSKMD